MSVGALDHIKVVDLTQGLSGPFCTRLLADYGADVIKVEPPAGDMARTMAPFAGDHPHPERSIPFLYLNTNKRSITLDIETPSGRDILLGLARNADVLVENFSPGKMASLGLDYATLERTNPRLVMTSITPFGQSGPYAHYRSQEITAYATGGIMFITGLVDREPLKHGLFSQGQYAAGINGYIGTLLAVYGQQNTGEGQHVDVSMMESIASQLITNQPYYGYMGAIQWRQTTQPVDAGGAIGLLPTKDGWIAPSVGMQGGPWEEFCAMLGRVDLIDDTRFTSMQERAEHIDDLVAELTPTFQEWNKYDLFHTAQEWRFIWAVVQTPEEIANCPHLDARGFFVQQEHPVVGNVKGPGALFKMSETPYQARRPAPLLGQHNLEVYGDQLGYTRDQLVTLRERGVI